MIQRAPGRLGDATPIADSLLHLVDRKPGHFRLESGHHSDSWLELDQLFLRPSILQPHVAAIADKLVPYGADLFCGPWSGGAFLAQMIASVLRAEFAFAERIVTERTGLYPVDYRVGSALRPKLAGKRVAIVDDAISAGSAVRATVSDVVSAGAQPVVVAALLTIGSGAETFAKDLELPLERLAVLPHAVWLPDACPMCAAGAPISNPKPPT